MKDHYKKIKDENFQGGKMNYKEKVIFLNMHKDNSLYHLDGVKKKSKNLVRCSLLTVLLLIGILLSSCNAVMPIHSNDLANLTVVLSTTEGESVIGNNFTLVNNTDQNLVYHASGTNRISFGDIKFGSYSLIYGTIGQIIDSNIKVHDEIASHTISSDYKDLNHRIITVQNNTGNDIIGISISEYAFEVSCDPYPLLASWDILVKDTDSHRITILGDQDSVVFHAISISLVSVSGEEYRKYNVSLLDDIVLSFTEDDLFHFTNHHIQITVYPDRVFLESRLLEEKPNLHINGLAMDLQYFGMIAHTGHGWGIYFNFNPGQTYLFDFSCNANDIKESLQLTIVQDMIVDWPEYIDENLIELNWEYYPNNAQYVGVIEFSISRSPKISSNESLIMFHYDVLSGSQREYFVPAELIPSPEIGRVDFRFETMNYVASGPVIIRNSRGANASYLNGVFRTSLMWDATQGGM